MIVGNRARSKTAWRVSEPPPRKVIQIYPGKRHQDYFTPLGWDVYQKVTICRHHLYTQLERNMEELHP